MLFYQSGIAAIITVAAIYAKEVINSWANAEWFKSKKVLQKEMESNDKQEQLISQLLKDSDFK